MRLHPDVIGAWTPGWRPARGWCGPWRLDRRVTPPVWIRPVQSGEMVVYFAGPPVRAAVWS